MYNFYAVIIGTEILNNRREDKHFKFIRDLLNSYGHTLFATFIIKDDKELIKNAFELIKKDEKAVLFSFGGIGSTPDDLTRQIAADVFTGEPLVCHEKFEQDIIERFKEEAYPHRIHMAQLPKNANLIKNPVNNMSGFELEHRYFFVPGFPQMSHPMIKECVEKYFSKSVKRYRKTLLADTSENTLIDIMKSIPSDIELSSLPILNNNDPQVELSLSYHDPDKVKSAFDKFVNYLKDKNIGYVSKD
ncbi:competence/damage-inducible protein A [Sulfurimonas sp. HSL-1716]|uniref:competence/damage-inducible protein A n=1 Tax=Hydrocurvibacter sulfurireducens TaxID=3131937 RepID=UPI0031F7ADB5